MSKIAFKTPYGDRNRVSFQTVGESETQQHFAKEADIKTIIKKHDRTGIISHVARGIAHYGDYSEVNEYREALDMVNSANASFMELPAELRKMFDNDAGAFFEFATDPKNEEKMVQMGLKVAPPSPEEAPSGPAKKAEAPAEAKEKSDE
jgi:phage internal scaffolding protein